MYSQTYLFLFLVLAGFLGVEKVQDLEALVGAVEEYRLHAVIDLYHMMAVDIKMVTADETGPAPTPEPEKERQGEEFYCEAGIQDCRTCFADGQCERQKEALSAKRAAFYPEGLWEYCDGDPLERLRSAARFPVRETGSGWIVAAGYCCLCGCDLDIHTFQSERDALLFACLLNAVGYEPPHNIACSPCHAEYMKDCI